LEPEHGMCARATLIVAKHRAVRRRPCRCAVWPCDMRTTRIVATKGGARTMLRPWSRWSVKMMTSKQGQSEGPRAHEQQPTVYIDGGDSEAIGQDSARG